MYRLSGWFEDGGRGRCFGPSAQKGEAGARLPGHKVVRPVSCFIEGDINTLISH